MTEEVKLWEDKQEQETYENLADLFAIIKTTEKLEKAYVRDVISPKDYECECMKLISQFKTLSAILKDRLPSVESFVEFYKLDCPAAVNRLIVSGMPATLEHQPMTSSEMGMVEVAKCAENFINAMDCVKLNMVAVDQVHLPLSDLLTSLDRVSQLPSDFVGKVKMAEWVCRLNKMSAVDKLTQQQVSRLSLDLETSYSAFLSSLSQSS